MRRKILKVDKTKLISPAPEVVEERTTYVTAKRRPVLHTPATLSEAIGTRAAILVGKSPTAPVPAATKKAAKQAAKAAKKLPAKTTAKTTVTRTTVTRRKRAA